MPEINPHAWLSTVPLLGFLIAVYFQPEDNVLKRWWTDLRRLDSAVLREVTGSEDAGRTSRTEALVFWFLVSGLAAGSLLSLLRYAGFLVV